MAEKAIYDWLPRIEFTLDHPVAAVWPQILRWERWIEGAQYSPQTVGGKRGVVGETIKITQRVMGDEVGTDFYTEVVKIIENKQFMMKILPLKQPMGPIEAIAGYEVFDLHEHDGGTVVVYQTIAQLETSKLDHAAFQEYGRREIEAGEKLWPQEFIPRLKALIENAAR